MTVIFKKRNLMKYYKMGLTKIGFFPSSFQLCPLFRGVNSFFAWLDTYNKNRIMYLIHFYITHSKPWHSVSEKFTKTFVYIYTNTHIHRVSNAQLCEYFSIVVGDNGFSMSSTLKNQIIIRHPIRRRIYMYKIRVYYIILYT